MLLFGQVHDTFGASGCCSSAPESEEYLDIRQTLGRVERMWTVSGDFGAPQQILKVRKTLLDTGTLPYDD